MGIFRGGKIFVDMEKFAGSCGKNSRLRVRVHEWAWLVASMVTVLWVNISWFASQPRKNAHKNYPPEIPTMQCLDRT